MDYGRLVLKDLNYNSYLKVPALLGLQEEISRPPHHDEMFFIVIHQSFELWFKEVLHETDLLVQYFRQVQVSRALKVIKRINAILANLADQIQLLSTLTPVEFSGFRDRLRPASGFQSAQFREIEFAWGLRDEFFLRFFEQDSFARQRLERWMAEPTVYDEFIRSLAADGCDLPRDLVEREVRQPYRPHPGFVEALERVYRNPADHYHWILVFEALLDFDMLFGKWRAVHHLMVARTIGTQAGTGGSEGLKFLQSRLPHRFFPELWQVRDRLFGPEAAAAKPAGPQGGPA